MEQGSASRREHLQREAGSNIVTDDHEYFAPWCLAEQTLGVVPSLTALYNCSLGTLARHDKPGLNF